MAKDKTKKSFFKKALEKYDAFCQELGIANGACRSCVPIVREDFKTNNNPANKPLSQEKN